MKTKLFLLLAVASMSLAGGMLVHAEMAQLVVIPLSGEEHAYALAQVGKILPNGDMLELWSTSGTLLASEPVADIRKIVPSTTDSPVTATEQTAEQVITIFPNPAQERLVIQGAEPQTLRVFDLQGRLIKQTFGTEIAVGDIANGLYLLQVGTQLVQFMKQ